MGVPDSNWRRSNEQVIFFVLVSLSLQWILLSCSAVPVRDNANYTNPPPRVNVNTTPPGPRLKPRTASFRPGIAVIVATLTAVFSITFLLLVYAKHCKSFGRHTENHGVSFYGNGGGLNSVRRKNSGIDRAVVESLPVFRFGSLTGLKEGLECAVCLNVFETNEVLRLLPKCKHAFHVECVDTWLDGHSTCPLCRYRVDPEDVLLIFDHLPALSVAPNPNEAEVMEVESGAGTRRISGRHSFDGVRGREKGAAVFSFRMSLDGFGWKRTTGGARSEATGMGCFERYQRKDGSLVTQEEGEKSGKTCCGGGKAVEKGKVEEIAIGIGVEGGEGVEAGSKTRWEHTINVVGPQVRWSDVQPSDLRLCVRSEMLMMSPGSLLGLGITKKGRGINGRSVSEITGMGRFSASGRVGEGGAERGGHGHRERQEARRTGVVSKWLGRVSSNPDVSDSMPAGQSLA